MLEVGEHLQTWRLPTTPGSAPVTMQAERIGDHRLAYLDYEGPVSGDRGTVARWDAGEYTHGPTSEPGLLIHLKGKRWCGSVDIQDTGTSTFMRFSPDDENFD